MTEDFGNRLAQDDGSAEAAAGSERNAGGGEREKWRIWRALLAMTLAIPLLVVVFTAFVRVLTPAEMVRGWRVVVAVSSLVAAELFVVAGVYIHLRRQGRSLRDLGWLRPAPLRGWVAGILLGIATAAWGLANPALGLSTPLAGITDLALWRVAAGLVAGLGAGFCEEVLFRGYAMTELKRLGHGPVAQVLLSSLLFGLAHIAVAANRGWIAALAVIVPTALLGALYAVVYILSRRSVMPAFLSHAINDYAVIPWLLWAAAKAG